jgi:nicotinate-nucleotide adenylyltransferase
MKVGIYGGSFNPIHFGHTGLAKWVLEHTDIDEVWLMVSPNNPLKDKSILADEQERLAAAKQAIGDGLLAIGKRIIVSDFEFHLPRPTYTANTLRALVQEHPQHEFTLIIGEDNLQIFNKWRESEYILQNYRIFAYPRKGCSPYQVPQGKDIRVLYEAPYFDISSTELRKNLEV